VQHECLVGCKIGPDASATDGSLRLEITIEELTGSMTKVGPVVAARVTVGDGVTFHLDEEQAAKFSDELSGRAARARWLVDHPMEQNLEPTKREPAAA
jgi:hypothetical protein